jgi:hypothetical protein
MNWDLFIDKTVDFFLIFIGLYAAIAVQRYQDDLKERAEYVVLLGDFQAELQANREQHGVIERDLGAVTEIGPASVLGPMKDTFSRFEKEMREDEEIVECLHAEFATLNTKGKKRADAAAHCHKLYAAFDKAATEKKAQAAQGTATTLHFDPVTLSPFYRYEVWELYVATGAKLFKNKDLAVKIGEIYNNARVIEKQVADIESTYNDTFLKQVGNMLASETALSEIVHDEENDHGLSPEDLKELSHVGDSMKEERYATLESKSILEAKVRRMKNTVKRTNGEIDAVVALIGQELGKVKK